MKILVGLFLLCLVSCASQEIKTQYSRLPDMYVPNEVTDVRGLVTELKRSVEYNAHIVLWIRLNIDPEYGLVDE